jgi:hypothetical protein
MTDLKNLVPADLLIDLYARLRNELGDNRRTLDPNETSEFELPWPS